MKRMLMYVIMLLTIASFTGCGGSGDPVIPGEGEGTITGKVYAPNGVDPVSGALVYVVKRGSGNLGPPSEAYEDYDYTSADGSFTLEEIPTGEQTIKIQKGAFQKEFDYTVKKGANALPTAATTLPSQTGGGGTVEKMAVVTGFFDSIENVLAKIGLAEVDSMGLFVPGTEQFTVIDGMGIPLGPTYTPFLEFFSDPDNYADYRTIFLNCGIDEDDEYDFFQNQDMVNNLRDWVTNGGRLYATDWSYDFVEQLFPEYVKFYGDDPGFTSTPGSINDAERGDDMEHINATILDDNLLAWLKNIGATNPDDTVEIEGWLSGWAVIDDISADVKAWVEGPVLVDGVESTRVITISFRHGDGMVFFSSYHTEDFMTTEMTPQDRILQYLIFELL